MIRRFIMPVLLILLALPSWAQTATSVRVDRPSPNVPTGAVIATVNGQDRKIADNAWQAWLIQGGKAVLYSGLDGAGGFENEGQSLWRYDVATNKKRKLMTEIFMIAKVVEARTRSGRTALLVTMNDGGLGAEHVAVVDPLRGEVWRHNVARFLGVRNGRAVVGVYNPHTWGSKSAKPRQTLYLHLDRLLQRRASPMWPVGVASPGSGTEGRGEGSGLVCWISSLRRSLPMSSRPFGAAQGRPEPVYATHVISTGARKAHTYVISTEAVYGAAERSALNGSKGKADFSTRLKPRSR